MNADVERDLQEIRGALIEIADAYEESTARKRELIKTMKELTRLILLNAEKLLTPNEGSPHAKEASLR